MHEEHRLDTAPLLINPSIREPPEAIRPARSTKCPREIKPLAIDRLIRGIIDMIATCCCSSRPSTARVPAEAATPISLASELRDRGAKRLRLRAMLPICILLRSPKNSPRTAWSIRSENQNRIQTTPTRHPQSEHWTLALGRQNPI
jgi:hypothetical protein